VKPVTVASPFAPRRTNMLGAKLFGPRRSK